MPKKNRETRNRGLFLDPVKVDEEMRRLNIKDAQQLATAAGRSLPPIEKIWHRRKMDEDTADAIAGVLGRTVDYLELKDVPATTDPTPQPSHHPFLEQIKAINDALSYLYATLQKATHLSRDFRAEALASVHGMGQKVVFLNPIPDESINGREGSLIITFPISRHDAQTLMNAFIAGDLEEFEIVSVTFSTQPPITLDAQEDTSNSLTNRIRNLADVANFRTAQLEHKRLSNEPATPLTSVDDSLLPLSITADITFNGVTAPDATVMAHGWPVKVQTDGSFTFTFKMPAFEFNLALIATSKSGELIRRLAIPLQPIIQTVTPTDNSITDRMSNLPADSS